MHLFPFRYDKSPDYSVGRALEHLESSGTILYLYIYKWYYSIVHDKGVWVVGRVGKWGIDPRR